MGDPCQKNIPNKQCFSTLRNKNLVTPLRVSPTHINQNHLCKCWLFSSYLEDNREFEKSLESGWKHFVHWNSLGVEPPACVTCLQVNVVRETSPGETSRKDLLHEESQLPNCGGFFKPFHLAGGGSGGCEQAECVEKDPDLGYAAVGAVSYQTCRKSLHLSVCTKLSASGFPFQPLADTFTSENSSGCRRTFLTSLQFSIDQLTIISRGFFYLLVPELPLSKHSICLSRE